MNILLFYTGHRQLIEIRHSARFAHRFTEGLRTASVVYHCNNPLLEQKNLYTFLNEFPQTRKRLIHTNKNSGFRLGHIEAIADSYPQILSENYDWVIHLHADVYLTDENRLLSSLATADVNKHPAIMFPLFEMKSEAYTTDLFAWKPREVPVGVFSDYIDYVNESRLIPEEFLYQSLRRYHINPLLFRRYRGRGWQREIDEIGAWHPHDNLRVEYFLTHGVYLQLGPAKNLLLGLKSGIRSLIP